MIKENTTAHQWKCFSIFLLFAIPLTGASAALANHPVPFFISNTLLGLLAWTYLEYHLHRFWSHGTMREKPSAALERHLHHHKHPGDIKVSAMQRTILLLVSALLFAVSAWWNNYFTLFAGFFSGFAYSFFSHWLLHRAWSARLFPRLHRFHIHHHCKHPDRCFGFTTVFWDIIFRTIPPPAAPINSRIMNFYYGQT
jgi:Fatty acid hydroxylase superfamily